MRIDEIIESRIRSAASLDEGVAELAHLLGGGYSVWADGALYFTRQLVGRVHGLRIEVFAREHPPPHFHISGGDIDAVFSLLDCTLIEGKVGGRERALVEWWYQRSRPLLINTWNETRPANCPVGPVNE